MEDVVETFMRTCLIWQQDKIEQKKSGGLLEPLPTPKGPWDSVFMDFITCLPKSEESGSIIVVVDRFSKSEIHEALWDGVVQDYGDGFELLHEFSSPNGRENREGECTIGALSSALSTRNSPFELVTGCQLLTPNALAASYEGSSLAGYKTMKEWHEQADLDRASLDKAVIKMKKWADERRRHVEFEIGYQVMVKLLPQQFKSLRKVHKGLIRRYEGPFSAIGRVGKVSYRVQLPPKLKIHPVFHVSFLKPYHGDEEDPERGVSKREPTAVVTSYDREVEEILLDRTIRRRGVPSYKKYLIKWRDLLDSEASWEVEDLLWQWKNVLEALGSPWKLMEDLKASCRRPLSRQVRDKWYQSKGRDDLRQNPKKRGTSKDVVASLDKRVAGVETSMAELKNQVEGLEGLDFDFTSMREDFQVALNTLSGDLKREIHDLRDSFMGEITKIREEFRDEVSTLHQVIEALQADMALCKRSLASGGGNTNHGPKIDVPKPSPFVGKREARAVDDFLWEMEQYLEGVNVVDDASKIKMVTRYLKDTGALWWRRRYCHTPRRGLDEIRVRGRDVISIRTQSNKERPLIMDV
ncbi:putative retrotransposon gag domain, nucleotide-binding alpha-beta plait domain protein [Tanacetum coccineum]